MTFNSDDYFRQLRSIADAANQAIGELYESGENNKRFADASLRLLRIMRQFQDMRRQVGRGGMESIDE